MMKEYIYILGNGFNWDLEVSVNYDDFFRSCYWHSVVFSYDSISLISYIQDQVQKEQYNIEEILKSYIKQVSSTEYAKTDEEGLEILELAFSKFVDAQKSFSRSSKAYRLLRHIQLQRNREYENTAIFIYSFCYTLFDRIRQYQERALFDEVDDAQKGKFEGNELGGINIDIDYIHGRSSGGKSKAIFGLSCDSFDGIRNEIRENYAFLLKEKHRDYMPCKKQYLLDSLRRAQYIEFFGFSFSEPDLPYFKDWLQCTPNSNEKSNIIINAKDAADGNMIIETMKTISGSNWDNFCTRYTINICASDKDSWEDTL